MTQLTPQQKLSLATDKNIAVTAGAGTGKTRILVERYLHILLTEQVDIKELLAITFTDKAAAEMLERVSTRIDELLNSSEKGINKARIFHLKNRLNAAYISTIHSFCSRLLRENPIEAGVDPDFKVLNDFQSNLLQKESINELLESVNQHQDKWIDFFRIFGLNNITNALEYAISHQFEIEHYLENNGEISSKAIFQKLVDYFLQKIQNAFDESVLNRIDVLVNSIPLHEFAQAKQHEKGAVVVEAIESYLSLNFTKKSLDYWKAVLDLAQIFTNNDGFAYKNAAQLGGKKSWSDQTIQIMVELSETIVPVAQWKVENPSTLPDETDQLLLEHMPKLYELIHNLWAIYHQKKSEISSLDFDDMQLITYKLLITDEIICHKIKNQFKYIMVDEFQDTNLLQWLIIEKLGDLSENKFFIVGDPKQSIYGFRNADVRVFNIVKESFSKLTSNNSNITLSESFRFKEEVNNFINDSFSTILQLSQTNPWEVEYDRVSTSREEKSGGTVELALLEHNEIQDIQAEFIARRILQISKESNTKFGDITILLRTRNHLPEIEEQLRNYEIPFKTIGGIGFYQRQEIYDIYHLIQFLIDPHNDMALVGILRSPFVNISDEGLFFLAMGRHRQSYWNILDKIDQIENLSKEDASRLELFYQRASKWLGRRDRVELSTLLEEIIHECFYQVSMLVDFNGEQLFANLKKIIRIAAEYEKSGFTSLIDFAESLKKLINSTTREGEAQTDLEDETTVKVMTVHQAKGLEFKIVFFPYLEQSLRNQTDSCFFDESWGLVSNINPAFRQNKTFYLFELLKHNQKQKELAELKRLFYVACSRAQDHLILTSSIKENKIVNETPQSWLLQSLNINIDNFDLESDQEKLPYKIWTDLPEIIESEIKNKSQALVSIKALQDLKIDSDAEPASYLKTLTDQPRNEIFSATQLMTFIKDKTSYFNRYHLGYFEEDYERLISAETDQDLAIIRGKIFHKYLEKFPNVDINSLLLEFEVLNSEFAQELQQDLNLFDEKLRKSEFLSSVLHAKDFRNETSITMKLGDSFLTGTIDRMYKNELGNWMVVDYKSNKITRHQLKDVAESYRTQVEVYALLLSAIYPQQDCYAVSLYFIHLDDFYRMEYSKEDLLKVENELLHTLEEIKKYYPYTDKKLFM